MYLYWVFIQSKFKSTTTNLALLGGCSLHVALGWRAGLLYFISSEWVIGTIGLSEVYM